MSTVNVVTISNIFEPTTRKLETVAWEKGLSVIRYVPVGAESYVCTLNGQMLQATDWPLTYPNADDQLVFAAVPQGGDGGKSFLRLAATVALSVAAPFAAPALGIAAGAGAGLLTAGAMIAGSLIINSILPPPSSTSESLEDGPSYGLNSGQNTAAEGVAIPMVYGKFRTAGNIVEYNTENESTKDQSITIIICVGEAPIWDISDVRVNDQPIENYNSWSYSIKTSTEALVNPHEWDKSTWSGFYPLRSNPTDAGPAIYAPTKNGTLTQFSRGDTISMDDYVVHETTSAIDAVRVDVTAPSGLIKTTDEGKLLSVSVPLDIQYRELGTTGSWIDFPVDVIVANDVGAVYDVSETYTYTAVRLVDLITGYETYTETETDTTGIVTTLSNLYRVVWNADGDTGVVERGYSGRHYGSTSDGTSLTTTDQWVVAGTAYRGSFVTTNPIVSGKSRQTLRYTFRSPTLRSSGDPEVQYEIRVKRNTEQLSPDSESVLDEIVLESIWEIENEPVGYQNAAMLALKVRLSDQINGFPNISYVVNGRKVRVRGVSGQVGITASDTFQTTSWIESDASPNPAWVALDILTSESGGDLGDDRIDMVQWFEWAKYCDEKGLVYNGIFDVSSNVWDSIQLVMRVGHAQIVRVGTKYTVSIERAQPDTMVFGNGNIIEGSLQTTWLSMEERANEVSITFNDEENDYSQSTIKAYAADIFSDKQRSAGFSIPGVTNSEQAYKEAILQLNMNKFIRQSFSFETGLDALGVIPGDIIRIQSDHPLWGYSGRLLSGNTNTVANLDQEIINVGGMKIGLLWPTYVYGAAGSVDEIGSTYIGITNLSIPDPLTKNFKILVNGSEFHVSEVYDTSKCVVSSTTAAVNIGDTVELIIIDHIAEYAIVDDTTGAVEQVTLLSDTFESVPFKGQMWMVGQDNKVSKPFRVNSVEMGSNLYQRRISGLEYSEYVYDEDLTDFQPVNYSLVPPEVGPVIDLVATERSEIEDGALKSFVDLEWKSPEWGVYDGAAVYVSTNGGEFNLIQKFDGNIVRVEYLATVDDFLTFKVQAKSQSGDYYPYSGSPIVEIYVAGTPTQTGDVLLPEDIYRGGSGDVWFALHNPLSEIIEPVIVYPVLEYVGSDAIDIYGSKFLHPDGTARILGSNSGLSYSILDTPFSGTFQYRPFYICWSDEDIRTRIPTLDTGVSNQFNLFITTFNSVTGEWRAVGADESLIAYEPVTTDCLVGRGSKVLPYGGIDILTSLLSVDIDLPDYAAGNNKVFHQETDPSIVRDDLIEGDIWFDLGDSNHQYRWNGSQWISVRDATASAALELAFDLEQGLNQEIDIYFASSTPTPKDASFYSGDIHFDISNSARDAKVWNGSTWVDEDNNLLVNALRDATRASDIADGLIVLKLTNAEPTDDDLDESDLWYSASSKNLHNFDGTSWNVYSVIGTLWDDVDGDGRPDSYVGNTGSQLLVDYNFEEAALGERSTWQGFKVTGSTTTTPPPYSHTTDGNVDFSSSQGESGSACMIMYGAGLDQYVHARSPILFPCHASEKYSFISRVITSQTVSPNGNEGYGVVCQYFDANLNYLGSSPIGDSDYGPTFNHTSNPNWHTQSSIIETPSDIGSVAYMTVCCVYRANNGDSLTIRQIDATRMDSDVYEGSVGADTDALFSSTFGNSSFFGATVLTVPVGINVGDQFTAEFSCEIDNPLDDSYVGGEYESGLWRLYIELRSVDGSVYSVKRSVTVNTEEGADYTQLTAGLSTIADEAYDEARAYVFLINNQTSAGLGSSLSSVRDGKLSVIRSTPIKSGF